MEEVVFLSREGFVGEEFEEVAKVVATAGQSVRVVRYGGEGGGATHEWKDTHFVSSERTRPEVIMSSAKSLGTMPISSCLIKSMPDFCNSSIDSGAYMSSLSTP